MSDITSTTRKKDSVALTSYVHSAQLFIPTHFRIKYRMIILALPYKYIEYLFRFWLYPGLLSLKYYPYLTWCHQISPVILYLFWFFILFDTTLVAFDPFRMSFYVIWGLILVNHSIDQFIVRQIQYGT